MLEAKPIVVNGRENVQAAPGMMLDLPQTGDTSKLKHWWDEVD